MREIGMDFYTDLKYEGVADNWTVRCECGARLSLSGTFYLYR